MELQALNAPVKGELMSQINEVYVFARPYDEDIPRLVWADKTKLKKQIDGVHHWTNDTAYDANNKEIGVILEIEVIY